MIIEGLKSKLPKVKLLIVDDSSLIRKILKSFFANDPDIEIVAEAKDGEEALDLIYKNDFDIVLLDFEMPRKNGLAVLKDLKYNNQSDKCPPVLIFSSLTDKDSKQTIQCLLAGAKDYVLKPSGAYSKSGSLDDVKDSLREKILVITKRKVLGTLIEKPAQSREEAVQEKSKQLFAGTNKKQDAESRRKELERARFGNRVLSNLDLIVIGSSTGGPAALEYIFKKLPRDFPVPILVVQHMPENFTGIFVDSLAPTLMMKMKEVTGPCGLEKGTIYLAGGGKHMVMETPGSLNVQQSDPVNFCIPAVDVLFESVAKKFCGNVLSIVLTGMGRDGCDGVAKLKAKGNCYSVAQDEASSVVWAMPKVVYEAGLSDELLSLNEVGELLTNVRSKVAK